MKRYISIIIFTLFVTGLSAQLDRTVPPSAAPAPKINLGKSEKFTLPNGLKVIVVQNNKVPAVSYSLTLDIDPILEGDVAGYTMLAGAIMRSGTTSKTKVEIDETIDFIGATLNAHSKGIYARSLKKHSETLLEIMSDVLLNPTFPQEELDKNVKQMESAIQMGKDEPSSIADNIAGALLFGLDDPYGEIMTEETLKNIDVDILKKYHQTYFRPNVSYLIIVGDITLKEAKKQVAKYFGNWEKKDVPKHSYNVPKGYDQPKVAIANKEGANQSSIYVKHIVPITPGHPDAIKVSVMNGILGGGSFSARLFRNLREDKAYTYGAYSDMSYDKRMGTFSAEAQVRTSVTDSALHEILFEMKRLQTELVDKDDVELTKSVMAGGFSRSLESPQTIANFALNIDRYNLPANYYETYLEKLAAVTVADVMEMAKKYLHPDKAVILAVGDVSAIKETMKAFSPTGEVTEYNYYGNEVVHTGIPEGVTSESVLNAYINAIGGEKILSEVKDIKTFTTLSMQGMEIEIITLQKAPNKVKVEQKMMGNVMSAQIFDGVKGKITSPMGEQIIEGEMANELAESAVMFPELNFIKDGVKLELVAVEDVDGKSAYKMNVEKPNGQSASMYFDIQTGLKIKELIATPQGAISTSYTEYKEFDGILMPVGMKQSMGPQSFDMNVKSVEINKGIDDSEFKI